MKFLYDYARFYKEGGPKYKSYDFFTKKTMIGFKEKIEEELRERGEKGKGKRLRKSNGRLSLSKTLVVMLVVAIVASKETITKVVIGLVGLDSFPASKSSMRKLVMY